MTFHYLHREWQLIGIDEEGDVISVCHQLGTTLVLSVEFFEEKFSNVLAATFGAYTE